MRATPPATNLSGVIDFYLSQVYPAQVQEMAQRAEQRRRRELVRRSPPFGAFGRWLRRAFGRDGGPTPLPGGKSGPGRKSDYAAVG